VKTIGMLGGMSWESTALYYQIVNRTTQALLGGLHSAQVLLHSVDFEAIKQLQYAGDWDRCGTLLADSAARLETAGADLLVLCTNTMHIVAPQIEQRVRIPLLHIADPTAAAIKAQGITRIGLLGTRFTMEQAFYRERLEREHGLAVVVPDKPDRDTVHGVIYDELCHGTISAASREQYRAVIARLVQAGAQGIIFGCTEITLLVGHADASVPVFDTTALHAQAAARFAIGRTG
jgi:aspartate racemase